jgi:FOG: TPR repeat, SEL1 subfamily
MNGSRSYSPRAAKAFSLDALSRTIEGLEARIEGLMASTSPRESSPGYGDAPRGRSSEASRLGRTDPLKEIRDRQRALEADRHRMPESRGGTGRRDPTPARADLPLGEITEALLGLRQELKADLADSLARELRDLREEFRDLKAAAIARPHDDDLRQDLDRLAQSINRLGTASSPAASGLRHEFEELRSLMDGLAREDTVREIDSRWSGIERRLQSLDGEALHDELARLAHRLDDIKAQIGSIGDNRAIRSVEENLLTVAKALEQIGAHIDPGEQRLQEQFAGLDTRLDEISRAIVAGNRSSGPTLDPRVVERIEDRIAGLARQIEALSTEPAPRRVDDLGQRLDLLTERVAGLANEGAAERLEERLDQLAQMLQRPPQQPVAQPELANALIDISRKIDALETGAVNDQLADRLERLARVIEGLEERTATPAPADDRILRSLDERLAMIAERLDDTARMPAQDSEALRSLEDQIAHLSSLFHSSPRGPAEAGDELTGRIAALEDYMATSDEYIIEAARQAAETVLANYTQSGHPTSTPAAGDTETISALTESLKLLQDISRNSEERNQRTLESLQSTLLDITERLERLDTPKATRPTAVAQAPQATATAEAPGYQNQAQSAAKTFVTDDEEIDLLAEDGIAVEADTRPTSRPSLLAGLSKRLMPGRRKDETAARQMVEPSPSIDPADILPPDEANELLEPGSGAPDVRKILERVRAAKSNPADSRSPMPLAEGDRTDYIAAARRAAQAAALEASQTHGFAPEAAGSAKAGQSLMARYRRPILLAAGAILLVVMAMPLVRTLTNGERAPAVIETAAQPSGEVAPSAEAPAATAPASENTEIAEPAPEQSGDPVMASPPETSTDGAPVEPVAQDGISEEAMAEPAPAATMTAPVAEANSPAAAPAAAVYEVPASITPASLAKAAAEGDPLALFEIGARYTEARGGLEANLAEAALWYQRAAEKGFAPAQYRLANLYEKGTGVQRDLEKSRQLYEMAASRGNASAMHNLAVLYANGSLGVQEYDKAAEWFSKAAELGVTDSQFNLAILLARGNGVQQDLEASYKWFAVAAREGDKDAAQKRDDVANAMKPELLERARAQADSFKPKPLDVDANSVNLPDEWVGKGTKTASVDMGKVIRNVQAILNNNGFDAGPADGVMGQKTVSAIKAFQKSIGHEETGRINDALVKELLARNK